MKNKKRETKDTSEENMNEPLGTFHWHGVYTIEWNGRSKAIEQGHAMYIPGDREEKRDKEVRLFDKKGNSVPLPAGNFRIIAGYGRNVFCVMHKKKLARAA